MRISTTTREVFWIATILAAAASISRSVPFIPIVNGNEFLFIMLAFVLLWLGNVLKGF
ncbi:MAG: hypothetical protein GYA18_02160 [Chloroflexi bacterium]|nr:hypothetical protein [Chloroflexota bacterium]